MSDYDNENPDDADLDVEDTRTRTVPRDVLKRLEKQAAEGKALAEQNAKLERRLAFADAGINTSDAKLGYFAKGYDGPLDPAAIKAAAVEAGFLDAPAPVVPDEERAAHERVSAAAAGVSSAPSEDLMAEARRIGNAAPKGQEHLAIAEFLRSKGQDRIRMPTQ
jgi:hypothetical protein